MKNKEKDYDKRMIEHWCHIWEQEKKELKEK